MGPKMKGIGAFVLQYAVDEHIWLTPRSLAVSQGGAPVSRRRWARPDG